MSNARTLKVIADDGQVFTLPVDHEADGKALVASLFKNGGVWAGNIFLPWHRVLRVEVGE